jgi:hypothetical protein
MVMGKIAIIIKIVLCFYIQGIYCQKSTNHAILIGVDTYKFPATWNSPPQLKKNIEEVSNFFNTSSKYQFKVTSLINEAVKVDNIRKTLTELNVSAGDYVMIYLTGHGCQVEDTSAKKKNAMHQGFICYDTPERTNKAFSKTVLLGDSLGVWITNLRRKLGSAGQLFILAESCHSGLITRGRPPKKTSKQTRFVEENIGNLRDLAPLVVFSSSRAFNQTSSIQKFTLIFLSEFKNFRQGSYFDLFDKFYLAQRREVLQRSDIQLAVNLDVDDPGYLRMGFFQDSIYPANNLVRIIDVSPDYDTDHLFQIDRGIFEGVTQGSIVTIRDDGRKQYCGKVEIVKNASSWVSLKGASLPSKPDLWKYQVQIAQYNFRDTLLVSLSESMPADIRQQVLSKLLELKFVQLDSAASFGGYSIGSNMDSLLISRNKDSVMLSRLRGINELKSTLLKIQISRFIRRLQTSRDSTVTLVLKSNEAPLSDNELVHLKAGDSLVIVVHSDPSERERFYCLLHLQDEFISQMVPVNFQVNESECKLPPRLAKDILVGGVKVGQLDGSFLLITSETPFDLRQVLLQPLTKSRGRLNKMQRMINDLFLTDAEPKPLYDPGAVEN